MLKEAHASLMTLSLEAARTDSDSAIIRCFHMNNNPEWCAHSNACIAFHSTVLEECKFAPDRIQVFTTLYTVSCVSNCVHVQGCTFFWGHTHLVIM